MLKNIFLFACLATVTYSLTCQKCSETAMMISGIPVGDGTPSEDAKCVPTVCAAGQDVCTYGYAQINYKGPFDLTGEGGSGTEVDMNIIMNWFKDCGIASETSCSKLTESMSFLQSGGKATIPECDMKTCTTDNCNDKTVKEINPTPLEAISCYTCMKRTMNGTANNDTDDPDQPECSDKYKKQCPLGTENCISGNIEVVADGVTMNMEYFKDCSNMYMNDCETLEKTMKQASDTEEAKINSCNIKSCKGDLCNSGSAKEVADYSSGFLPVTSLALAFMILFYWF